jgi:hypothetical protein
MNVIIIFITLSSTFPSPQINMNHKSLHIIQKYDKALQTVYGCFNYADHETTSLKSIPNQNPNSSLISQASFTQQLCAYQKLMIDKFHVTSLGIFVSKSHNIDDIFTNLTHIAQACLIYLSTLSPAPQSLDYIMNQNRDLFIRKNQDYGNSFADFALIGICVRLNDKINRLKSLTKNCAQVMDESIDDTINDLYNYCLLGLMYNV